MLFVMRATTHFHYYRSIVEAAVRRGHKVEVLFERFGESWSAENYLEPIEESRRENGNFSHGQALNRKGWLKNVIGWSRRLLNYNHNLNFKDQPKYFRDRSVAMFPSYWKILFKNSLARFFFRKRTVGRFFRYVESKTSPEPSVVAHIKKISPEVVIASAGNLNADSADIEYIKAAKSLGVHTVIPVISWDFLTTKGTIHILPDRLLVWNKFHESEALKYHHFPEKNMRVIGAPVFDKWLSEIGKAPDLDRDSFAKKYGLRSEDPFVLYLGSTANVAADESWVVQEMRKALDESGDEALKKTQIIVRPHPAHWKIYGSIKNLKDVRIVPEIGGMMPDNKSALELFYDSVYHSVAIAGINTSGMIDAIIAGKPCIAMLIERYRSRHEKTAYFQQLLKSDAANLARDGRGFAREFKKLLSGNDEHKKEREAFIKDAIRPRGFEISAGEAAIVEVENLLHEKN